MRRAVAAFVLAAAAAFARADDVSELRRTVEDAMARGDRAAALAALEAVTEPGAKRARAERNEKEGSCDDEVERVEDPGVAEAYRSNDAFVVRRRRRSPSSRCGDDRRDERRKAAHRPFERARRR